MKRAKLTCLLTLTNMLLAASISFSGEWYTESEVDPFTDTQKALAIVAQVDGVQAHLLIQCENREFNIAVNFNPEKITPYNVRHRAGKDEAQLGMWHGSSSETAVFHPQPYVFLNELLNSEPKKLVIQVQSQEGFNRVSFFDLKGISEAIKPLRESGCTEQSDN